MKSGCWSSWPTEPADGDAVSTRPVAGYVLDADLDTIAFDGDTDIAYESLWPLPFTIKEEMEDHWS